MKIPFLPYKLILFPTDILFWIMVFSYLVFYFYSKKNNKNFLLSIQKLRSNPYTVICFYIIIFYLFFAMMDSIHFKKIIKEKRNATIVVLESKIVSALDIVFAKIANEKEKTYSKPFATKLFSRENIEQKDGTIIRDFPPLNHRINDSKTPKQHQFNILFLFIISILLSIFLFILLYILFYYIKNKNIKKVFSKQSFLEKKPYFIFFFLAILFICSLIIFSQQYYVFGTDRTGNDILYLALKGIRTSVIIGTLTTLLITPIAIILGIIAGYFGGWIDSVIQYIYTVISSIPNILLIAVLMLLLQVGIEKVDSIISAEKRLLYLCIILGCTSWTELCRLIRAETLKIREIEFVQAAKALGQSSFGILIKHIVPNVSHIVLITVILQFSGLVLVEAILSYIGIGVDPAMKSWGNIISQASLELTREPAVWWNLSTAFAFMLGLVFSVNIFADGVRDAFDPKWQEKKEKI